MIKVYNQLVNKYTYMILRIKIQIKKNQKNLKIVIIISCGNYIYK